MKNLSNKIIVGLISSFIGLSPCLGTQVFAMWEPSTQQEKAIEDCTKEELLAMLPNLWLRFWTVFNDSKGVDTDAIRYASNCAIFKASGRSAYISAESIASHTAGPPSVVFKAIASDPAKAAAWNATRETTFNVTFKNAWALNGAAYNLIINNDITYFKNLVITLQEQIHILENIVR